MFWARLRVIWALTARVKIILRRAQSTYAQEHKQYFYFYHFWGHLKNENWKKVNKAVWTIIWACELAKIYFIALQNNNNGGFDYREILMTKESLRKKDNSIAWKKAFDDKEHLELPQWMKFLSMSHKGKTFCNISRISTKEKAYWKVRRKLPSPI